MVTCCWPPTGARSNPIHGRSTSKWVHLNFGDAGLLRLFTRAHACLRPGGRFILEPQPWSSYRKRVNLTPTIQRHFREIAIRPTQFADVLRSAAVGFKSVEVVHVPYDDRTSAGFTRRPLWVCTRHGTLAAAVKVK